MQINNYKIRYHFCILYDFFCCHYLAYWCSVHRCSPESISGCSAVDGHISQTIIPKHSIREVSGFHKGLVDLIRLFSKGVRKGSADLSMIFLVFVGFMSVQWVLCECFLRGLWELSALWEGGHKKDLPLKWQGSAASRHTGSTRNALGSIPFESIRDVAFQSRVFKRLADKD